MPRLDDLQDVLFSVGMRPLVVKVGDHEVAVRDHMAIVDTKTQRVVSVVGRDYRLVTHQEALDLGRECARVAFPEAKTEEWFVSAVDGPMTGSTCFIDLAHNSTALDFSCVPAADRPEVYGPFVRVTNSYNRTRALSFDIGFYRKVCRNGLILRESLVQFKFSHQRRDIGKAIRFQVPKEKLAKHQSEFSAYLAKLRGCAVPRADFNRFLCAVLGLRAPAKEQADVRMLAAWTALAEHVDTTASRYAAELGENAYAMFNAVTEFASRPPDNFLVRRDRNSLQRRAGQWSSEFAKTCQAATFDLDKYLEALESQVAVSARPEHPTSISE